MNSHGGSDYASRWTTHQAGHAEEAHTGSAWPKPPVCSRISDTHTASQGACPGLEPFPGVVGEQAESSSHEGELQPVCRTPTETLSPFLL